MSTLEDKMHKGGAILHFKPHDIITINVNPTIIMDFEQVGCIIFCEKIQGYHLQLTKEFASGFDGVQAKVGSLNFPVSTQPIVEATEIPLSGEEWFKGMDFDLVDFKDFLKPTHQKGYGSVVPRS